MNNKLKSLLLAGVVGLASGSVLAEETKGSSHEEHVLKSYVAVADALYKDDLAQAKGAAVSLGAIDSKGALAKSARSVSKAEDIAAARESFKALSAEAVKLVTRNKAKGFTVMACPMVKDGKGVWLSADGKVNNPYFGAKMPHCGGVKK